MRVNTSCLRFSRFNASTLRFATSFATLRRSRFASMLVRVEEHVSVVKESVVTGLKRSAQLGDVIVELCDFCSTSGDIVTTFALHFLQRLVTILEEIHLKEVVLFKLGKVVPQFFLLEDVTFAIRITRIQIDVR